MIPDDSSPGLSKSKNRTDALLRRQFDREKVAPYAKHNDGSDPRKMLFPMYVGDEALEYPFGLAIQKGSSGSENLARRRENNLVQQTILETENNSVVKLMTRCSAVH